ncbi:MAG: 16S rRNA (guanine(527)-N(7))-methyltransferase RsmG [Desulfobulbaceae bacterium]|nr:16S rRNA (guanine(527)-N(7))-methyltransferase RsmG [Desulfobulbaceae bacterium]
MACREIMERGCQELGITFSHKESIDRLVCYYTELVKWNRRMNLVSQAPEQEMVESHFLDSLTLLPQLDCAGRPELLDVGTGAGFPGLVLKAACPELVLTLVEPRAKRVTFLRHIVRSLQLVNVTIIEKRLEPTLVGQLPTFPVITSRAVANISDFLALAAPFSPLGGTVLCMKGPKADEEISQWQRDQPASPYTLRNIVTLTLPFSLALRNLVIFCKIRE